MQKSKCFKKLQTLHHISFSKSVNNQIAGEIFTYDPKRFRTLRAVMTAHWSRWNKNQRKLWPVGKVLTMTLRRN